MAYEPSNRPVIFGEVLFDRFPDGSVVLGGAPFNVAWHLQAFGQNPLFVSGVGDDSLGRRIRDTMTTWGMDSVGLQQDADHPTGTVEVTFQAGEPSYDIVDNRAYDFVAADGLPPIGDAALLYHGSLALRGDVTRAAFRALLTRSAAPRFFDVNLRPPWWTREAVLDLIRGAAWVKLNAEELGLLDPGGEPSSEAGEALRERYGLRAVVLTRGAEGAELLSAGTALRKPPELLESVVDTVGAGDGFTSIVLMGLLQNWPPATTLERAQDFASAIVGVRGATVQDPEFYARFARAWGIART